MEKMCLDIFLSELLKKKSCLYCPDVLDTDFTLWEILLLRKKLKKSQVKKVQCNLICSSVKVYRTVSLFFNIWWQNARMQNSARQLNSKASQQLHICHSSHTCVVKDTVYLCAVLFHCEISTSRQNLIFD